MGTMFADEQERTLIERIATTAERPKGVGEPTFNYGSDHTGDEAVYITYPVSRRATSDRTRGKVLADFTFRILDVLNRPEINVLPYVRYSDRR